MITNWDLVSHMDEETGNMVFSLVIDGTENDARLIAKKLKGFAKEPGPADPPFVYAFALPDNLDESIQEKIRTATREGVDAANKVSQFVPGGVLGDPLFNSDPSDAGNMETFLANAALPFNQSAGGLQSINLDEGEGLSLKTDPKKDPPKEEEKKDAVSLPEMVLPAHDPVAPTFTSYIPATEIIDEHQRTRTIDDLPEMVLPAHQAGEKTFTSFIPATQVGETFGADLPKEKEAEEKEEEAVLDENKIAPTSAEEVFADPYDKSVTSPKSESSANKNTQNAATSPSQSSEAAEVAMPLDDKDMLIKDMEGTVLNHMPIEDIFAAETKYDMFVDVEDKEKSKETQQQREDKLQQATAASTKSGWETSIFTKNLKEQTDFIDINEIKTPATAQEEQVSPSADNTSQKKNDTVADAQPQSADVSVESALKQEEKDPALHTVRSSTPISEDLPAITLRMTPYQNDLKEPQPTEETPAQDTKEVAPVAEERKTDVSSPEKPKETPKKGPSAKAAPKLRRKESMDENTQKTFFRIKLKKPSAKSPVPPSAPKPAAPNFSNTIPPKPIVPPVKAPVTSQANKSSKAGEKTKTIDHSIQVSLSELKKHNWPLEVPLVPTYTLSNMVMSVNRFAHATAISVIESPGKLYNPLVLHGATGTGKSHFLNAMAYAFSQKFGQANIFMTNGVRLSRGIQRYITEGNIEKFDQFMSTVKVLLIDDIHLLAINEQNRAYISKLLNTFLKEQKQIVITSKYPPESLEKLEELIKFRLDSGWISELKSPTGQVQFKIAKKMLVDNHVDLTDNQITEFFSADNMTLGTVQRSVRRMKVLENLLPQSLSPQQRSAAAILERLLAPQGEDETSRILTTDPEEISAITPIGNGEWGRIGFFYPANCSDKMNWMVYSLQERARELGIEGGPEIVVRSSYATENIISSAFKIANLCDNKKLKGAVILGPSHQECDLSIRENFYDILTHMLEVMLIRCGIINFESLRQPSMYVKVLAELLR